MTFFLDMRFLKVAAVALTTALLGACAVEHLEAGPPPTINEFATDTNYRIGVGDELHVQVWRNDELSAKVPVRPDGKISSPLVGDITAAGLSTQELAKAITEKLGNYVRNPEVTVIVTNPASADFLRRVRVTGAVRTPVTVTFRQGMTVLDVVLQAGGLTEFASPGRARLYRTVEGRTKIYPVDLDAVLQKGDLRTNYTLYPSDVVTVPERSF
ncbi:MAG: Polysaccharide biosynthesis/export protein [Verrucomicrobiaceae bacterium]|nr:Polysaccharide biosynthesis/export protein [Verrucomicrobiaceae bacterium]